MRVGWQYLKLFPKIEFNFKEEKNVKQPTDKGLLTKY